MIARHWTGVARRESAVDYIAHLKSETFPQIAKIPGFVKAAILHREIQDGIEFLIVTEWESMEAIRQFAGDQADIAIVPETVQKIMLRYDQVVRHYTMH